MDDSRDTVRRLAQLVGLNLPEERIQLLAERLPSIRQALETLASADLGDTEPLLVLGHPRGPAP